MRRRGFLRALGGVLLSGSTCRGSVPPTRSDPGPLVLTGARLIDGTGADPIDDATVVVDGGRISFAEPPPDAEVLDLSGRTLLPGFINTHVHRGYSASTLEAWARGGVTTVRDVGTDPRQKLFATRDQLNAHADGARLVAAGPLLTVPGGYPMKPWGSRSGLAVTSVEDAIDQTRALLDDGADVIKLAIERGGSFGLEIPSLSPEQIEAIVATAHVRGVPVSAHVLDTRDLIRALDGGVDDIAHMVYDSPDDGVLQRVIDQGLTWVPTLELWHGVREDLGHRAIDTLERFVGMGGRVALGTDYAGYFCEFDLGMPRREIAWMREAGMTPMQIIEAATREAARVCNLGAQLGTLETGMRADLFAVEGDPLTDPTAFDRIALVVREGGII